MVKEERLQLILNQLTQDSKVRLDELSEVLKVSEDTVRRDIKELDTRGLLKAVRGGAILHSPIPHHYRDWEKYDVGPKKVVATKALDFLQDGQVVFFDGGTSVVALAASLPKSLKITVVTNSFPVVNVLEDHPKVEVIFAGGRLYKTGFTTMGQETLDTFGRVHADICFLGICSIHESMGVTAMDYEDAQVKKLMVEKAAKTIAMSSLEKTNTVEPFYICPVTNLDVIITEAEPDNKMLKAFAGMGISVV
jgi:DeoR/GlpR family transcriptional regulator of sugar metabolism